MLVRRTRFDTTFRRAVEGGPAARARGQLRRDGERRDRQRCDGCEPAHPSILAHQTSQRSFRIIFASGLQAKASANSGTLESGPLTRR